MKKIILFVCVLFISTLSIHAQKKKDLLEEIDKLRKELKTTEAELNDSRKKEKATLTQVKTMEAQVKDLKETNASLLTNMSSFTELSNQKAKNLETSLKSLQEKDKQIKTINDAIGKTDSTKLATLTVLKNALGSDANIAVQNGAVLITLANTVLFGEDDNNCVIEDKAKGILGKIANALNAKPDLKIIVEGNSNAINFKDKSISDNWDLSTKQAASVVRALQNDFKVDPKRMDVLGKSEYGSQSIETATRIIIDPKFDKFYGLVKENMKNGSKK
ncbi:chemotaxis protein MotB [Aquimarina sp. EL_43]|uniref:OmpA family protein n=1 Tax=unclassified Aquimarina TaxID=2627091 RepID=UPI0018CAD39F|nr:MULTISPECIES: OmpA family protein [unclassified Aquimarina]MBG6129052.1 chemotaxis protein MotB [Aquimarina sp. EL_35]MBG6150116.1 chemotaxis protein MotB [Aquimarina sp. EL_32]MBG6167198.1 chemotaxis protein MotB [Aquimarina sp. EL_43]